MIIIIQYDIIKKKINREKALIKNDRINIMKKVIWMNKLIINISIRIIRIKIMIKFKNNLNIKVIKEKEKDHYQAVITEEEMKDIKMNEIINTTIILKI